MVLSSTSLTQACVVFGLFFKVVFPHRLGLFFIVVFPTDLGFSSILFSPPTWDFLQCRFPQNSIPGNTSVQCCHRIFFPYQHCKFHSHLQRRSVLSSNNGSHLQIQASRARYCIILISWRQNYVDHVDRPNNTIWRHGVPHPYDLDFRVENQAMKFWFNFSYVYGLTAAVW